MQFTPQQRLLVVAGAVLFMLGLLQGGVIQSFTNPRMALSAHLTAVQCGMALMIAGLVWPAVRLSPRLSQLAQSGISAGMYGLWLGLGSGPIKFAFVTVPDLVHSEARKRRNSRAISRLSNAAGGQI